MCIVNGFINVTDDIFIVHLDTLSVVNGCVDLLTQELAYNNTYCIQVINQSLYQQVVDNFNRLDTDGDDLIINCQNVAAVNDLDAINNNDIVNQVCIVASVHCFNEVESQYINTSGRNYYDIAAIDPDPFSPFYYIDFLAQH